MSGGKMSGDFNDADGNGSNAVKVTRRALLLGAMAAGVAACTGEPGASHASAFMSTATLDPRLRRQRVRYQTNERPGTIVVDTGARFLYVVEENGWATRYGVGRRARGREFPRPRGDPAQGGVAELDADGEHDPSRQPVAAICRRRAGRTEQSFGRTRALSLSQRARHHVPSARHQRARLDRPGHVVGCIRMMNDDVIHLYERTPIGTRVVVT
jgi:hypothetical protein